MTGRKQPKLSFEDLKRIQKERLEQASEEDIKEMRKTGTIGFHKQQNTITQDAIDKLVAKKGKTIEKLTLQFPSLLYNESKEFQLNSLDFSPLSSLEYLEEISIYFLNTNTLSPILKHTKNVRNLDLGWTGPIDSPLLGEIPSLLPNLKEMSIHRPLVNQYELPEGLEVTEESRQTQQDYPDEVTGHVILAITNFAESEFVEMEPEAIFESKFENMDMSFLDLSPYRYSSDDLLPISKCLSLQSLHLYTVNLDYLDLSFLSPLKKLKSFRFGQPDYDRFVRVTSNSWTHWGYALFSVQFDIEYKRVRYPIQQIDLTPLSSCNKLQELAISGIDINDVSLAPLSSCKKLENLDLSSNSLSHIDLIPLSECNSLKVLNLRNNNITEIDLSPLSGCEVLQSIDLSNNSLVKIDLSPLSNCSYIEEINLSSNMLAVIDLSPLSECHMIKKIDLTSNPIERLDTSMIPKLEFKVHF